MSRQDEVIDERLVTLLNQAEEYARQLVGHHHHPGRTDHSERKKHRGTVHSSSEDEETKFTRLTTEPSNVRGTLREYQIDGINWLTSLYETKINGILADEMGLGKTIQTICFLAHLKEIANVPGPHLVVGPKSVLGNWTNEFKKWCPDIRVVKLIAAKPWREDILRNELVEGKFDACITSYEGINICYNSLKKFNWVYIIIDEAHKIKNEDA
jgi:SWI/SNF-related matrix-associated actin-dependent regulator of chromatin subfamily A member 5